MFLDDFQQLGILSLSLEKEILISKSVIQHFFKNIVSNKFCTWEPLLETLNLY